MDTTDKYLHTETVHNLTSPNIIVPFLNKLLTPTSVVDVGCGTGTFLKAFQINHVNDLLGIDGPWVKRHQLHIDSDLFIEADLEKPFGIDRQFDVVLCLEVVEHLSPAAVDTIIQSLVSLGKKIVFSAAVPFQGGQNHINEQTIDYWQEKFSAHGYHFYDVFRKAFWNNAEVDWWYKQNMFLVAHESVMFTPEIAQAKACGPIDIYIHPDLLKQHVKQKHRAIEKWQRQKLALKSFAAGHESLPLYGAMLGRKIKNLLFNKSGKD